MQTAWRIDLQKMVRLMWSEKLCSLFCCGCIVLRSILWSSIFFLLSVWLSILRRFHFERMSQIWLKSNFNLSKRNIFFKINFTTIESTQSKACYALKFYLMQILNSSENKCEPKFYFHILCAKDFIQTITRLW